MGVRSISLFGPGREAAAARPPRRVPADLVQQKIFRLPAEVELNVSRKSLVTQDLSLDISNVFRTAFGGVPETISKNAIFSSSPLYALDGITTCYNFFLGLIGLAKAISRHRAARKCQDRRSMMDARLEMSWRLFQLTGGLGFIGYRGMTLASLVTYGPGVNTSWIKAPTELGRTTASVGIVGSVIFSLFFLALGVFSGYYVVQGQKLLDKLKASEDPMAFLEKKLIVNEADVLRKMRNTHAVELYGKKFDALTLEEKQTVYRAGSEELLREAELFGNEGLRRSLEELKIKLSPDIGIDIRQAFTNEELRTHMLALKVEVLRSRREHALVRMLGEKHIKEVKAHIASKAETGRVEAVAKKVLEQKVVASVKKQRVMNALQGTLSVLGFAAMILGIIFPIGIPAFAAGMFYLAVSLGFMGLDMHYAMQAFKQDEKAKLDSNMMWMSVFVCLLVSTLTAAMTFALPFAWAPLFVMGCIALGWIASNGVGLYMTKRGHDRYRHQHPDLAFFKKVIKKKKIANDQLIEIFLRLPEEHRKKAHEVVRKRFDCSAYELLSRRTSQEVQEALTYTIEELRHKEHVRAHQLKRSLLPLVHRCLVQDCA